ncbi:MAG: helix-turn-helix domain-containing protein [Candidatus Margulisbacteria bacterium]|nr:helix-turn-helix domain-containing protein [Candidatus Margulisiibacteriota bacterium]
MRLKNRIRSFAAEKGMSLAKLADKIGQSRSNLFKKLDNETIKYREMENIADALEKNIEWKDKNGTNVTN